MYLISCVWIFRHFKWVLNFAFKGKVTVLQYMEVGISVLEEEENIFLYVLSVFSVTFSKLLQVTTMVTHWMESPEQIIFFFKSLFFHQKTYSHAFPSTSGTAGPWRSAGRKSSIAHTMDGSAGPHWKQWGFPKHKKQSWAMCHQKSGVENPYLAQGPSRGSPSWCGNKAALLGCSLRSPPNKGPSPFPSTQKNSWFLSLLIAPILALENTTSFQPERGGVGLSWIKKMCVFYRFSHF